MLRATIGLTCLLAVLSETASAQTTALPTAAPPVGAAPALGVAAPRVSYSMSAGFVTAGRFGSASYLTPLASYQLTRRFSVFAGLTYMHIVPGIGMVTPEARRTLGTTSLNRYVVQAGGAYALSPRVALVGSAWKDLTPNAFGNGVSRYSGFGTQGSGVNMRADFKVSEHMTLSGGVRVSNGAAPGYSPFSVGPF
ncbi:hypothetical protein SAMN02745146_0031 [Hymenobacter daecheongensis DSM 21074]|uniref:Outer membrane protein beta-barrel domain-containing protein n=1 Tax=Hymenobacter daecheongensis DSM 21074 TaxID=1121955 RepID=A0A1M6LS99_9BACT|nr:hypothetical protein [Hymenobacter daecheongensis]SHJ74015.1 hypothetical protein SAMN02745146_0031 [Hymenobacter daecheongensis DSM 21074]